MAIQIGGTQWDVQFKRMFAAALDSTAVWDDYGTAVEYAANRGGKYVPYAGQIISVTDGEGAGVYKLVLSASITEEVNDGRKHYQLEKIGGLGELKETFTLRDNEEKIEKIWEFLAGLRVLGVLNADDVKTVTVTVDKGEENPQPGGKTYVQSGGYIRGGKGFGIYKDANGSWCLDIDNVQVRGSLAVNALKVNQTEYLGGEVILTVGGSIEATEVEETDGGYKVYFKNSDGDGREIFCQMTAGDLAKHQTYNEKTGSRLYWLKVDEVGSDYVVLSRLEGDTTEYSTPRAGDEIVHLGNVSDKTRQAALIFSARTQAMRIYTGIDTTSLGNAEAPIDLNPVESKILAKFITMSTGVSLDKAFTDVRDRMGVLADDVDTLKNQSDKQFIIWFTDYTPTLKNKPYTDWIADGKDERELHIGDILYNTNSSLADGGGRAFHFEKDPVGNYRWGEITDKDTLLALEKAAKAQDTADGKRRVFIERPIPPYDPGDSWVNATYNDGSVIYDNDMLVVKKGCGRSKDESFRISDWQPATKATTAYLAQLADQILAFATNANKSIAEIQGKLQTAQDTATQAALDAARGIGLANAAQEAADSAMAALQVTDRNITALVGGDYLNADGTVKESYRGIIDTTASRVTTLVEQLAFDTKGHVTNIDRSGLVLTSKFAGLFTEQVDKNGIATRSEITTAVKDGISKAVIHADQIEIDGKTVINDYFFVDENGHLTIGDKNADAALSKAVTVYGDGEFTGTVNATGGVFSNVKSKNGTWMIDAAGNFKATSGEFTGTVNATSGVFSNVKSKNGTWMIDDAGNFKATSGEFSGDLVAKKLSLSICNGDLNGSLITFASGTTTFTLPPLDEGKTRVVYVAVPVTQNISLPVTLKAAANVKIISRGNMLNKVDEIQTSSSASLSLLIGVRWPGFTTTYWFVNAISN